MVHSCTEETDLDELIGVEAWEGQRPRFRYGPLALAMMSGEELVLENSQALSTLTRAKLKSLLDVLFIEDTSEFIRPGEGFHLTLR